MNFHEKSKTENWFFIRFSTFHIFHKKGSKTEGGGVCISLVGTERIIFFSKLYMWYKIMLFVFNEYICIYIYVCVKSYFLFAKFPENFQIH